MALGALKNVLQKVERTNRDFGLIRKGDSIVIALSGGSDSTALLLVLAKLKRKYALRLTTAHLDHGLQGSRSRRMLQKARAVSAALDVPFCSQTVSVPSLAKRRRRSLEEAGRLARYAFFVKTASKTRSHTIATAHTLEDQAETVLLHLLRGAGLRGLSGIPFKRPEKKFTVIRPLLLCRKKELVAALKENRVSFCDDPTNRDDRFTRNRVRLNLLPYLERAFNPQIKEALCGLQTACSDAQDYVENAARRALAHCASGKKPGRRMVLKIAPLRKLHPALRRETLSQALAFVKGDLKRFGLKHLADLLALVDSPKPHLSLHLPAIRVHKTRSTVIFHKQ